VKLPVLLIGAVGLIGLGAWWLRQEPSPIAPTSEQAKATEEPRVSVVATESPSASSSPAGSAERSKPIDSQAEPGTEDLRRVVQSVRNALPKKLEVKPADDEAAHHAGPELIRAGQALGDLAEYLERRPEEFRAASVFYANCAADETLMPASRAVCYAALMKRKNEWARGVAERVSRVGPEIIDIANNL
jgi:hypothetical protein